MKGAYRQRNFAPLTICAEANRKADRESEPATNTILAKELSSYDNTRTLTTNDNEASKVVTSELVSSSPSISLAEKILRETFGFPGFRPGQTEVIESIISGDSTLAVFPTGGGKSLCYQIPAMMFPGLTLIVSPLVALMKDQVQALQRRGITAYRIDSSLTATEYSEVMQAVRKRHCRLLFVSPERFNNERFLEVILRIPVDLFVVDEAHCISEWGHNFRPDYLKLPMFVELCRSPRVLTLTATAPPLVEQDIVGEFGIAVVVKQPIYRPNLRLSMFRVDDKYSRDQLLVKRLSNKGSLPAIVYVTTQARTENVRDMLRRNGIDAYSYHAGMKTEDRDQVQEIFMRSDNAVVVATIAFGMGIDKSNIRSVIHYNHSASLEGYAQEIGRAGRDGLPSNCDMLVHGEDVYLLEKFVYGDTPSLLSIEALLDEVFDQWDDEARVSLYDLSNTCDLRDAVLRTLLVQLELRGLLRSLSPVFAKYRFRFLAPHTAENTTVSARQRTILDLSKKAREYYHLDLDMTAEQLVLDRGEVVRAIDELASDGCIELKPEGVLGRYSVLGRIDGEVRKALAKELYEVALEREVREIERLQQVQALATDEGCVPLRLARHFGEGLPGGLAECGQCSWCVNKTRVDPEIIRDQRVGGRADLTKSIDPARWEECMLRWQQAIGGVGEPRSLARFAGGLSSPLLTRTKATRDPFFAIFSHVHFPELLRLAEKSLSGIVPADAMDHTGAVGVL
eukprot:CAMPEP_0184648308 /NCGR_PEP_ID=MMETSP0308-20130426/5398_1 /TAXON_ID=38269 /ORGANISM="Gloeochaete witrockiana, Strain SAG 46.84" /LENGTH=736 /DNA_ID=CAMNT_0027080031 /DNA_START=120 /DNA_END=2330 /DNA_ORIENTATION=+